MNCLEQYTETYKFSYRNTILQKLSVERLIRRTIIVFPLGSVRFIRFDFLASRKCTIIWHEHEKFFINGC